jgi:hypothetical protein
MAIEATPIEVWVEWRQRPSAAVVVPYVRATEPALIDYELRITRKGRSGSLQVHQTGDTGVQAQIPRALGEVLIQRDPGDECTVYIRLQARRSPPAKPLEHNFACPLAR